MWQRIARVGLKSKAASVSSDTLHLKCIVGDAVKPVMVWGSGGSPKKRTSQTDNDTMSLGCSRLSWQAPFQRCIKEWKYFLRLHRLSVCHSQARQAGSCGRSQLCRSAAAEYLYRQHLQPCISVCSPPRGDPPPFIFHWRPRPSFTPTCNLNTKVTHSKWQVVLLTTLAVCVAKQSLINMTDPHYCVGDSWSNPSTPQQSGRATSNLYVERTSAWTPHMTATGKNKQTNTNMTH